MASIEDILLRAFVEEEATRTSPCGPDTRAPATKPGTFRVVPPDHRLAALRTDYREMRPMFVEKPKPFDELLRILKGVEEAINSGK